MPPKVRTRAVVPVPPRTESRPLISIALESCEPLMISVPAFSEVTLVCKFPPFNTRRPAPSLLKLPPVRGPFSRTSPACGLKRTEANSAPSVIGPESVLVPLTNCMVTALALNPFSTNGSATVAGELNWNSVPAPTTVAPAALPNTLEFSTDTLPPRNSSGPLSVFVPERLTEPAPTLVRPPLPESCPLKFSRPSTPHVSVCAPRLRPLLTVSVVPLATKFDWLPLSSTGRFSVTPPAFVAKRPAFNVTPAAPST